MRGRKKPHQDDEPMNSVTTRILHIAEHISLLWAVRWLHVYIIRTRVQLVECSAAQYVGHASTTYHTFLWDNHNLRCMHIVCVCAHMCVYVFATHLQSVSCRSGRCMAAFNLHASFFPIHSQCRLRNQKGIEAMNSQSFTILNCSNRRKQVHSVYSAAALKLSG